MTVRIISGLPEELRGDAAQLYLEAFAAKLGPILGRGERAKAFLSATLRPENVLVALDQQGRLLGLAGFHGETGGFIGGNLSDMQAVYGRFSGLWRGLLLSIFEREQVAGEFLMDGVVVSPEARGQGVGGALIEAIAELAKSSGAAFVRLDVVDTNPRARALYERRQFTVTKESGSALFRPFFGFSRSATMIRMVGA